MMPDNLSQQETSIQVHARIDVCGLMCPEPLIQARLGLADLNPGQTLELLATDPHAELDLEVFCATTGHLLRSEKTGDTHWRLLITKG